MAKEQNQDQARYGVVYQPKILRNMREICEEMGVGPLTVKKWISKGAPIAVYGDKSRKRYSAEVMKLQTWKENYLCIFFP